MQAADEEPSFFSLMTDRLANRRSLAASPGRRPTTHELIRTNLGRSAMYSGSIEGIGPRYCPSIEDKIVKFGDRDGHQIFLEPEGLDDDTVYPNGISTSLPEDVQLDLLKTIPGLEKARDAAAGLCHRIRPCRSARAEPTLETRKVSGLFLAGQINGTTGYEEAAAQGIVAGLNAARKVAGAERGRASAAPKPISA